MSQKKAAAMVSKATKDKILSYITKSVGRFNSIKLFNLPNKSSLVKIHPLNLISEDTIGIDSA